MKASYIGSTCFAGPEELCFEMETVELWPRDGVPEGGVPGSVGHGDGGDRTPHSRLFSVLPV
jgi:hypothetical protein